MRVKLTVAKGSNSGKAFEVNVPQFVIGRAKGCQLRPQSDAISRQHCVICVTEESATIRDLGSRNGTVVNGEKIEGTYNLSDGDELRVGPLNLKVSLETGAEAPTKPSDSDTITLSAEETRSIKPAKKAATDPIQTQAMPAVTGPERISDSGDISAWLSDDDDVVETATISKAETRRFRLDVSEQAEVQKAAEEVEDVKDAKDAKKSKKKKEPGKLPTPKKDVTADSKEAAEQTLRKMFQRGL